MWVLGEDTDLTNGGGFESRRNGGCLQGVFDKRRSLCFALKQARSARYQSLSNDKWMAVRHPRRAFVLCCLLIVDRCVLDVVGVKFRLSLTRQCV
jgi:hypothetical protein